jgi:hypothetical protein
LLALPYFFLFSSSPVCLSHSACVFSFILISCFSRFSSLHFLFLSFIYLVFLLPFLFLSLVLCLFPSTTLPVSLQFFTLLYLIPSSSFMLLPFTFSVLPSFFDSEGFCRNAVCFKVQ